MASHASLILADLLTALRADLGVYDLSTVSSTPRVVIADGGHPPVSPPYVLISAPSREPSYSGPLTEYHVVYSCEWWGFAGAAAETTESRAMAALDLASEVVAAVQAAHASPSFTTLYTLTVLLMGWDNVFSDGPDIPPGLAMVHGTIRIETDILRSA